MEQSKVTRILAQPHAVKLVRKLRPSQPNTTEHLLRPISAQEPIVTDLLRASQEESQG